MKNILYYKTQQFIESVPRLELFANCGRQTSIYTHAKSWDEAFEIHNDKMLNNFLITSHNEVMFGLEKNALKHWAKYLREIKKTLRPKLDECILNNMKKYSVPDWVYELRGLNIHWVFTHYAIELQYDEEIFIRHYDEIIKVYTKGHFLCGWKGDYPNGQCIVY